MTTSSYITVIDKNVTPNRVHVFYKRDLQPKTRDVKQYQHYKHIIASNKQQKINSTVKYALVLAVITIISLLILIKII